MLKSNIVCNLEEIVRAFEKVGTFFLQNYLQAQKLIISQIWQVGTYLLFFFFLILPVVLVVYFFCSERAFLFMKENQITNLFRQIDCLKIRNKCQLHFVSNEGLLFSDILENIFWQKNGQKICLRCYWVSRFWIILLTIFVCF